MTRTRFHDPGLPPPRPPQGRRWRRVVIQKVDLDTALTALLMGTGEGDEVMVVGDVAPAAELADPAVLCIECGGSGQTQRHNFDHHETGLSLPPACRQALVAAGLAEQPAWARLVDYVAAIDTASLAGVTPVFPSLSDVFSGMLLLTPDVRQQLLAGVRLLGQVVALRQDPFGEMPLLPEWEPLVAAKGQQRRRVRENLDRARPFVTRNGRRGAYLEQEEYGGTGALYRQGYELAVLCNPRWGEPPRRKYTIACNRVRVDGLLPALNAMEPGWGGPSHGTIVASPRRGSRLAAEDVVAIVAEGC